jgi:hypothetical protein
MHATISTPEIYGLRVPQLGDHRNDIVVDMEYIPFHDVCYIILQYDKAIHEWLIDSAISIVDFELTQTTTMPLKDCLAEFDAKAASIRKAMPKSDLLNETEIKTIEEQIDQLLAYYKAQTDLQIPVGTCHGDLTFQNMLVDPVNRELCVFDFLDSFLVKHPTENSTTVTNIIIGITATRYCQTSSGLSTSLVSDTNSCPRQGPSTSCDHTWCLLRPDIQCLLQICILGCCATIRVLLLGSNTPVYDDRNREAMHHGRSSENFRRS